MWRSQRRPAHRWHRRSGRVTRGNARSLYRQHDIYLGGDIIVRLNDDEIDSNETLLKVLETKMRVGDEKDDDEADTVGDDDIEGGACEDRRRGKDGKRSIS